MSRYETVMKQALEKARKDLGAIRIGRANPALLESVRVTHMGKTAPLSQVAQINVKDAQTLMVVVSDEQLLTVVEKAILAANLNLNPQKLEAAVLKVPIPKMTAAVKESVVKNIGQLAEASKARVRSARQDARAALKKLKPTIDESRKLEKQIQDATDKYTKDIDAAATARQAELS